ncbi:hypothetical protein TTHERM_00197989 (macronuclear) [Tetrahymena thermophila SB210]|uniref:Uncharacterized protein n=1 Tax=Tetrahymena thermophila (strain SB210) TaxID=312017 RepID=X1W3Q1_TETTS|nr:hypothetical protein TTHERM_00197989 [Tetrahymena thermophila SB210]EDK32059.1 hypothetical protein TTHERM_00197989 [Tetrahymena thermophila SB210]|eukprot:XP_001471094.1 hypothetical protein TTHERM_00197989 [Tetrahymena thermophila SB210]
MQLFILIRASLKQLRVLEQKRTKPVPQIKTNITKAMHSTIQLIKLQRAKVPVYFRPIMIDTFKGSPKQSASTQGCIGISQSQCMLEFIQFFYSYYALVSYSAFAFYCKIQETIKVFPFLLLFGWTSQLIS